MNKDNQSVFISNDNAISDDDRSDEMTVRMPSGIKYDARHLGYRVNDIKHEGEKEMGTSLSKKELGSKNSILGNGVIICLPSPSTTISGGVKDHFQFRSPPHLNVSSSLRIEDIKGDSCLMSEKPSTSYCPADDNYKIIPLVKGWINNRSYRANNNLLKAQGLVEGSEYLCNLDSASHKDDVENLSNNTVNRVSIPDLDFENRNTLSCNDMTPCSRSGMKASIQQIGKQNILLPTDTENVCIIDTQMDNLHEEEYARQLLCSRHGEHDPENPSISMDMICKDDCTKKATVKYKHISTKGELNFVTSTIELISLAEKPLPESTANLEAVPKDANSTVQKVSITTNKGNNGGSQIEQKYCRKDKRSALMKQQLKPTSDQKMQATEKRENMKENKEKAPVISVQVSFSNAGSSDILWF